MSTLFKSSKFKSLLGLKEISIVTLVNKISRLHTFNIQWYKIYITIPKAGNQVIVRKYWVKGRSKKVLQRKL